VRAGYPQLVEKGEAICLPVNASERSVYYMLTAALMYAILYAYQRRDTMRQIEREMISAIKLGKCWHKANTEVYTNDNNASLVYLHGNLIATVTDNNVRVFDGGWQTNTTKSRLNVIINEFCDALTDGVFQKDYQWFIKDNNEVVKFESGYVFK